MSAMFSQRTQWKLTPNELSFRLEALEKQGQPVLNLIESNPTRCGLRYPKRKILRVLSNARNISYEPSGAGLTAAREAIVRYYQSRGFTVDPNRIFLTASTSESYSVLFRLLLNSGEHILVPRPSYPLFEFLAQLNDVTIGFYRLGYDKGWHIDLENFKKSVEAQTRAAVIVNPNNPTGSFLKQKERLEINHLCRQQDMAIICDEVFSDFYFAGDENRIGSMVENNAVLTFTLGGISKSLGLPQMKLGWMVVSGPDDLVTTTIERLEIILDTYLSVNTPAQNALSSWLQLRPVIQRRISRHLRKNRDLITRRLTPGNVCQCLNIEGGWYAVLRLPKNHSEEQWILEFLEADRVLVHPGYFFDFEQEAYIVLSLLVHPRIFKEGFKRILKRVSAVVSSAGAPAS